MHAVAPCALAPALVLAAPSSGSGKTLISLGLLRALSRRGLTVGAAKAGPDYIDPHFHARAAARPSFTLDPWAMDAPTLRASLGAAGAGADLVLIEGVMGLFDGPLGVAGSTADLAADLGLPVVLVVDASHQGQSIAALVSGFTAHRKDIHIAGLILNRVASARHETMLRSALSALENPVAILGAIPRNANLIVPSRHLGLVQAQDHAGTDAAIAAAADAVASHCDLDALAGLAKTPSGLAGPLQNMLPLGRHIAVARDQAFSFVYEHILAGWREDGVQLSIFSPLANEPVPEGVDAVYLPGGYPELHGQRLSNCHDFMGTLRRHANQGGVIYGECGGFMVLGTGLVAADGTQYPMAELLPLTTSFAQPKLTLGYRRLKSVAGPVQGAFRGHEFHYSCVASQGDAPALFSATDAAGTMLLPPMGLQRRSVCGSWGHIVARDFS